MRYIFGRAFHGKRKEQEEWGEREELNLPCELLGSETIAPTSELHLEPKDAQISSRFIRSVYTIPGIQSLVTIDTFTRDGRTRTTHQVWVDYEGSLCVSDMQGVGEFDTPEECLRAGVQSVQDWYNLRSGHAWPEQPGVSV